MFFLRERIPGPHFAIRAIIPALIMINQLPCTSLFHCFGQNDIFIELMYLEIFQRSIEIPL